MFKSLKQKSKEVLEYVRKNPGQTAVDVQKALPQYTMAQVSQAMWTLWNGRYITRHYSGKQSGNGLTLLEYHFKSDKPRFLRGNGKHKPKTKRVYVQVKTAATPSVPAFKSGGEVEVLIAVKGSKDTAVLTVQQMRDLMEQMKQLGF
jgi:hypothetical protein